ncbi:MAG: hypothetical protein P4L20_17775 [Acidimicrobiales bacterium]|nr:hypothetical protein [Acidimicrobiales bacterium]
MERVVRWVDVDGSSSVAGGDWADEWHGARVRPTGLVVFATVDTTSAEPLRRSAVHEGLDPERGWARASTSHRETAWRRLRLAAWRGVDWLLGR